MFTHQELEVVKKYLSMAEFAHDLEQGTVEKILKHLQNNNQTELIATENLMTKNEVANFLSYSIKTIERLIATKQLTQRFPNIKKSFLKQDVINYMTGLNL